MWSSACLLVCWFVGFSVCLFIVRVFACLCLFAGAFVWLLVCLFDCACLFVCIFTISLFSTFLKTKAVVNDQGLIELGS